MHTDLAALLESHRPGTAGWTRVRRYGGGSQGAECWQDAGGRRVVVKHHPGAPLTAMQTVQARVDRLRAAGMPAPATDVVGVDGGVFLVHDYLPGRSDPRLTRSLADHVLALVECEAGLADESFEWAPLIQASLTTGLTGYCEHESLQSFSDASGALLARVRTVGADPAVNHLAAPDLVHYDLHLDNVLSEDGQQVSGVIDWDAVRAGDRALDLGLLAFTSSWKTTDTAVLDQLWSAFLVDQHARRTRHLHAPRGAATRRLDHPSWQRARCGADNRAPPHGH